MRAAAVFIPIALIVILVTILMQMSEIRLPVLRISLHNDFAGDDYIAVRLHPSGTMPAMYAMSLFSLPLSVLRFLQQEGAEDTGWIGRLYDLFSLRTYAGIVLFMLMIVFLSFVTARLTIDPERIAEQLRGSGDYLSGIRPGVQTERRLKFAIRFAAALSAIAMCIAAGLPLILRIRLGTETALYATGITLMMLTTLMTGLMEELRTERLLEQYHSFL